MKYILKIEDDEGCCYGWWEWDRKLTAKELEEMHSDPYLMFRKSPWYVTLWWKVRNLFIKLIGD